MILYETSYTIFSDSVQVYIYVYDVLFNYIDTLESLMEYDEMTYDTTYLSERYRFLTWNRKR